MIPFCQFVIIIKCEFRAVEVFIFVNMFLSITVQGFFKMLTFL